MPPGTAYYSDSDMTQQAGTTTEYVKAVQSGGSWTITVDGNTCYVSGEAVVRGYTGPGYTIDRWSNARNGSVSILDDCLKLDGSTYFYQKYEDYKSLAGKTLTFSVLYTSTADDLDIVIGDGIGQFGKRLSPKTSVTLGTCTFTMSQSPTAAIAFIATDKDTGQYKIYAAKLELGPVQTLAHQDANGSWVLNDPSPNKALEILKCQRSFCKFHGIVAGLRYQDQSDFICYIPTPVAMRINPAVILDPGTAILVYFENDIDVVTSAEVLQLSPAGIRLRIPTTKAAGNHVANVQLDISLSSDM